MEYEAPARVLLVKVATPFVTGAGVVFNAVLPLKNVTVPVGVAVPETGFTVAERVTLVPALTGDGGESCVGVVANDGEAPIRDEVRDVDGAEARSFVEARSDQIAAEATSKSVGPAVLLLHMLGVVTTQLVTPLVATVTS